MSWIAPGGLESLIWCFACIAMRLGPILVTLPPFSAGGLSWMVRALLLSMICLSITPLLGMQTPIELPGTLGVGLGVLLCELIFGGAIALSVHLFLAAFQGVGATLAELTGLSLEDASDTTGLGDQVQQILVWVAGVLFVLCGAHRWVLQLVMESLACFPLGRGLDVQELLYEVPLRFGQALSIAVRLAFPAALVMVAIGIARAWITRGLSAWDRLAVGGPLHVLGLVWGMLMALSAIGWLYQHELASWMDQTQRSVLESQRWSSSTEGQVVGKDG